MRFNSMPVPCGICGKETFVSASRLRAGRGKYCGYEHRDEATRRRALPLDDRVRLYIPDGPPDACHEWQGTRDDHGYGKISSTHGKAPLRVSRVIWELAYGPIPEGMWVLHRCDNPPCCNLAHLFLGTRQDNIDDMYSKGREARGERHGSKTHPERHSSRLHPESRPRGDRHYRAKLTEATVRAAREQHVAGVSYAELAHWLDVSPVTIRRAIRGISWRHIR